MYCRRAGVEPWRRTRVYCTVNDDESQCDLQNEKEQEKKRRKDVDSDKKILKYHGKVFFIYLFLLLLFF